LWVGDIKLSNLESSIFTTKLALKLQKPNGFRGRRITACGQNEAVGVFIENVAAKLEAETTAGALH